MTELSQDEILQRLTNVFQDIFDDEDIELARETTAEDIEEWDSLNQIKLILACEKAFNLKLKARDVNALDNVGAMVDMLSELGATA